MSKAPSDAQRLFLRLKYYRKVIVEVRVKPNSKAPRIEELSGRSLVAYLKSPPVEGRANEELIERVAEHYGVPKSRVRIKTGRASRSKLVEVDL